MSDLDLDAIEKRLYPEPGRWTVRKLRRFLASLEADIPALISEVRRLREVEKGLNDALKIVGGKQGKEASR